jgi:hypothetical protein
MTWLTWAFCKHFAASWTHYLNEVYDATPRSNSIVANVFRI